MVNSENFEKQELDWLNKTVILDKINILEKQAKMIIAEKFSPLEYWENDLILKFNDLKNFFEGKNYSWTENTLYIIKFIDIIRFIENLLKQSRENWEITEYESKLIIDEINNFINIFLDISSNEISSGVAEAKKDVLSILNFNKEIFKTYINNLKNEIENNLKIVKENWYFIENDNLKLELLTELKKLDLYLDNISNSSDISIFFQFIKNLEGKINNFEFFLWGLVDIKIANENSINILINEIREFLKLKIFN